MKKLTILLTIIFIKLQYSLWLGKNGIYDYLNIKNQILIKNFNNIKLKDNNDKITYEINDINNNKEAIEEFARNNLGMIKKGEFFYKIINLK